MTPFRRKPKPESSPPPTELQKAEAENFKLRQQNQLLTDRITALNEAVRSIVMRLKILDIKQLESEMGEDGTIPMRMMVRELKRLSEAYDGRTPSSGSMSGTYSVSPSAPF